MAERGSSKFSGIFADRLDSAAPAPEPVREKPVRAETPKPVPPTQSAPEAPSAAAQRRRAGKRSDPAYKQFSVLLRKDTHRQAVRVLYDADNGQDVSDLVQTLLEQWVKKKLSS